jgi:hypothetical protein
VRRKLTEIAGGLTDSNKAMCPPFMEGGHKKEKILNCWWKNTIANVMGRSESTSYK